MIPEEKNIEQLFNNRIKDLEIAPPPEVWTNIEQKLEEEKHRSGILLIFKLAASFALFAVLGISSFWLYKHAQFTPKVTQNITFHKANPIRESYQIRPDKNKPKGGKNTIKRITALPTKQTDKRETEHKHNIPSQNNIAPHTATISRQGVASPLTSETSGLTRNLSISGVEQPVTIQTKEPPSVALANSFHDSSLVSGTQPQLMALSRINYQTLSSGYQKPVATTGQPTGKTESGQAHINLKDPFNLNASDAGTVSSAASEKKWSVGGCYSPNYSFRTISGEEAGDYSEKGLMAFSSGVKVKYANKSRWSFQSGIYYSEKGQVINDVSVINYLSSQTNLLQSSNQKTTAYFVNNSTGKVTSSSSNDYGIKIIGNNSAIYATNNVAISQSYKAATNTSPDISLVQSFNFIELPFIVNYKVINRKTDVHLIGGISTNILVDNKIYDQSDAHKKKLGTTDDVRTFNCSSIMGIGLDYPLTKKMTLSFDPTFNYNLNSFNKNSELNSHPYSFYFTTGINYTF